MTMEFCRFRDFAVPLLGLSTRHPSIHEMRATHLVDSSFRVPYLPDAAGIDCCLERLIFRSTRGRFQLRPAWRRLSAVAAQSLRALTDFVSDARLQMTDHPRNVMLLFRQFYGKVATPGRRGDHL